MACVGAEEEPSDANLCGAGILPFCVCDGRVLFMLGKEQVGQWKSSSRWSGFEGGRKESESCVQNAAREFVEETLGVFTPQWDTRPLQDALLERRYALRVCLLMKSAAATKKHVTYVVQFPMDELRVQTFEARRTCLLSLDAAASKLAELQKRIPTQYPFLFNGDSFMVDGFCNVTVLDVLSVEQVLKYVRIKWLLRETLLSGGRVYEKVVMYRLSEGAAAYCEWHASRGVVEDMYAAAVQMGVDQCAVVERCARGRIQRLHVKHDFIEKCTIRLWTVDELLCVVENRGAYRSELFRPYFMFVLEQAMRAFGARPRHDAVE